MLNAKQQTLLEQLKQGPQVAPEGHHTRFLFTVYELRDLGYAIDKQVNPRTLRTEYFLVRK